MLFNQLNIGDKVYIIEVVGTFKKTTEYNEGSVTQVGNVYEEPLPPGQFPMPNQQRKRVVDVTIQCNGETKKFTIPENKSVITERLDRTTVNVGFMSGSNFIGRFELTPYRVVQYVPQGKDEQGNRRESAKLFFDNEEDLDTFYRDMKKLFQLQQILKGEQ